MLNTHYNTGQKRLVKVDGRIIGYLRDRTFYKSVSGSKHRLRQPPAWAIDAEAFDTEIKPNSTKIVVVDRETGMEYQASVETFERFKGELDRGFGRQYFLPLPQWQIRGNGQRQLRLWETN
jgi:hypothetical protein